MSSRPAKSAPVKRMIDVILSVVALIILSPLLVFVAVFVKLRLGSPVLFRQMRPGLDGRPFELVKFRTMLAATGPDGASLSDQQRMTPLGRFLRSASIDELPELWNVLRGEMSLVGPRPLLQQYLPLYSQDQARRHEVRPGITGLAQVSGRNALSWDQKFALDTDYVETRSLAMDLRIMLLTVWIVARRESISAEGHATMPAFTGQDEEGS